MTGRWNQLLANLEQNPSRSDLTAGVISLCRTMQNPIEQANLLVDCSTVILKAQPLLGLQMLRLALLLAPRDARTLMYAKEIFKRRGRWAAEQRVSELMATLTQATAVTPPPAGLSVLETVTKTSISNGIPSELVLDPQPVRKPEPIREPELINFDFLPDSILVQSDERTLAETQPSNAGESTQDEGFMISAELSDLAVEKVIVTEPQSTNETKNVFAEFLQNCGLDPQFLNFSAGFSANNSGLVAFVNLLFTMKIIDDKDRTNATITLYRMIKEKSDDSNAEALFDRLFMQRNQSREQ